MINLLPPQDKRELQAARTNTLLIRYNILLIIAIGLMLLIAGSVSIYFSSAKTTSQAIIDENRSRVSNYATIEKQATEFRSNLATAKKILDNEVVYTKVILAIAHTLPSGTVLDTLNLDSANFGKPMSITARVRSYADALRLKDAFQTSDIISDAHFDSVTAGSTNDAAYPLTVSLTITIKKDAAK